VWAINEIVSDSISKASVKLETQGSHSNAPSVLRMYGKPVLLVEQLGMPVSKIASRL
jgi:hypothetical protein